MATNPKNRVSSQPRKQHRAFHKATVRVKMRTIRARVTPEIMDKYDIWTTTVRKGDTVKVMRGGYKGHVGKVSDVDTKKRVIFIEKVTSVKADGKEAPRPIHPSNVLITKLDISDPWRKKRLEGRTK